jgi:hypothetical protein
MPELVILERWDPPDPFPESRFGQRVVRSKTLRPKYYFIDPGCSAADFGEMFGYIPESTPREKLVAEVKRLCRGIAALAATDPDKAFEEDCKLGHFLYELCSREHKP